MDSESNEFTGLDVGRKATRDLFPNEHETNKIRQP